MSEDQFVKLCEPDTEHEALRIQSILAEENCRSLVRGLEASALGEALDGPDFIEVVVAAADFEKASEILEDILAGAEQSVPAWTCQCGEEVDAGFFVCWSCETEYDASKTEQG